MARRAFGALLLFMATAAVSAGQEIPSTVLTFPTGPADLLPPVKTVVPLSEQEYRGFASATKTDAHTVTISRIPPAVRQPLYGYNFVVGSTNRGWVLDGGDKQGWDLYLDWNGDGDLSQTKPLSFKRIDGAWRVQVDVFDGGVHWPCVFEIRRIEVNGSEKLAVVIGDSTVRRGTINIDGKRAAFAVRGVQGRYGSGDYSLEVDHGTGEPESYKRSEGYVNLFGKSYTFAVDSGGDAVTLEKLAEVRPDRPSLRVGSAAPEFAATDIDGVSQTLAGYRGRTFLLEFWSTNCGPCRAETPEIVRFFNESARRKVSFLGVASDTSESTLRTFTKETGIAWPQIREPFEGPLHRLYRVTGEPTYFLIGPTGQMLDSWVGGGLAIARVSKVLESR